MQWKIESIFYLLYSVEKMIYHLDCELGGSKVRT